MGVPHATNADNPKWTRSFAEADTWADNPDRVARERLVWPRNRRRVADIRDSVAKQRDTMSIFF